MSSKFWICVGLLSVIIAHTYVYTEFAKQSSAEVKFDIARYMTGIWYSMADGWEQFKKELKWNLEMGQKLAIKARRTIDQSRRNRKEARAQSSINFA